MTTLVGVNDVSPQIHRNNGVELKRHENIYRMIINQTRERFPSVRIIMMEPTYLLGNDTKDYMDGYKALKDYAKVDKRLAKELGVEYIPL